MTPVMKQIKAYRARRVVSNEDFQPVRDMREPGTSYRELIYPLQVGESVTVAPYKGSCRQMCMLLGRELGRVYRTQKCQDKAGDLAARITRIS